MTKSLEILGLPGAFPVGEGVRIIRPHLKNCASHPKKIRPSSKNFEMREQNLDEDLDEAAQHRVHLRRDITHHRLTQDPLKRLFI